MQLFNKLSGLSDKLLPHTEFTTPLSIEVCQERLENNLDFGVNRSYKTYKTYFETINNENYSFSIEIGYLNIVGYLESRSESRTCIKARVEISKREKIFKLIIPFCGYLVLLLFIGFDSGFSSSIFSPDGLQFIACCLVPPTLLGTPVFVFILDPLGERKTANRLLKAVVSTLTWPSD